MAAARLVIGNKAVRLKPHCLALAAILFSTGCAGERAAPTTQRVTIHDRPFTLELALDDATRARGLSGRGAIADDGGMLFVFPSPRSHVFWMHDCLVPIDILFLGPSGRVVSMHAMKPQPGVPDADLTQYPSTYEAQFAIELKGGTIAQLGVKLGEAVDMPVQELKRLAR